MKNQYVISIKGKTQKWGFVQRLTPEEAVDLSNDGVEVGLLIYAFPMWVVRWKLETPWRIATDIFNFRNPF